MRTAFDVMAESIVNPKCDECGASLHTKPDIPAMPRLCQSCSLRGRAAFERGLADYLSQERPRGRRVHVVKLPEGWKG